MTTIWFAGTGCVLQQQWLEGDSLSGACAFPESDTSWAARIGPLDGSGPNDTLWSESEGTWWLYRGDAEADGQAASGGVFAVCADRSGCIADSWALAEGDGWLQLGQPQEAIYLSAHVVYTGDRAWEGRCGGASATQAGEMTLAVE